jgi:hypothetical protein
MSDSLVNRRRRAAAFSDKIDIRGATVSTF